MSYRSRFHDDISTSTLEYRLATLLESGALAFFHHPFQEMPHRFYSIHQLVHLGVQPRQLQPEDPVLLGQGRLLFAPGTRQDLRLLDRTEFSNGVVSLTYGRA